MELSSIFDLRYQDGWGQSEGGKQKIARCGDKRRGLAGCQQAKGDGFLVKRCEATLTGRGPSWA